MCLPCDQKQPGIIAVAVLQIILGPLVALLCFEHMIRTWSGAKIQNWFGFEMVEFPHLSSSGTVVRSLALDWWQYIGILAMFAIPWPAQVNEVLSASRRLSRYDAGLKMILTSTLQARSR
jgi:hypothetical protein